MYFFFFPSTIITIILIFHLPAKCCQAPRVWLISVDPSCYTFLSPCDTPHEFGWLCPTQAAFGLSHRLVPKLHIYLEKFNISQEEKRMGDPQTAAMSADVQKSC